jgi:hypothetical protein
MTPEGLKLKGSAMDLKMEGMMRGDEMVLRIGIGFASPKHYHHHYYSLWRRVPVPRMKTMLLDGRNVVLIVIREAASCYHICHSLIPYLINTDIMGSMCTCQHLNHIVTNLTGYDVGLEMKEYLP